MKAKKPNISANRSNNPSVVLTIPYLTGILNTLNIIYTIYTRKTVIVSPALHTLFFFDKK